MGAECERTAEYEESGKLEIFFLHPKPYEQAVGQAYIERFLERLGMDICASRWGKQLGEGLVEFRIDSTLRSLNGPEVADEMGYQGDQPRVLVR